MKRFFIVLAFFAMAKANAQFSFDNVFGGGHLGYAKVTGEFSDYAKGGFVYNLEIGYNLSPKLAVGVSYGSAITAAIADSLNSGVLGVNFFGLTSYQVKGWYRFMEGNFTPYVALGLGLASIAEPDVTSNNTTVEGAKRTGLGGCIEAGLSISDFIIAYKFNLGGKSPEETVFNGGEDLSVNYHSFTLGYIYNF